MARFGTGRLLAGGLLALMAIVLYLPALGNGFHYDDYHSIVHNPHVRSLERVGEFFVDPSLFSKNPESAMYRPVLLTSYALNYLVGGVEPIWYHAGNVVLHGINVALLFGLLLALGMRLWPAVVAGLLFALTPLNSEAVNYVSSRSELLMACFLLASCWCHVRASHTSGYYGAWFAAAMVCGTLAILTKSVAAVVVPLWVLCDWISTGSWWTVWGKERRWRYLGMLGVIGVYLIYSRGVVGKALLSPVRDLDAQLWTQAKAWVYYLTMLPFPIHLSVERQFAVSRAITDGPVLVAVMVLASLAALLLARRGNRTPGTMRPTGAAISAISWARFGAAWAALTLLPSAVVPLIVLVNEHRCYLASAGAAIAIAACAGIILSRRALSVAAIAAWAVIAISLTVERGEAWVDEASLWRDATAKGPLMVKPHLRLADALEAAGDVVGAERSYRRAIELRPAHVSSRNNLGRLLMRSGRGEEAEEQFRILLTTSPDAVAARLNLAGLLLRRGMWQLAKAEYEAALRHGDTNGAAQGRLGYIALQHEAEPARALDYYDRGLSVVEENAERGRLLVGKGVALRALGQDVEAERAYRRALEANDHDVNAWFNLGNVLRDTGRPQQALTAFRRVVEFEPDGSLAAPAGQRIEQLSSD